VFEQLLKEKRGGRENALSPLKDERLQLASRRWLTSQPIGTITPRNFQHALNSNIVPSLNISLAQPLSERTASDAEVWFSLVQQENLQTLNRTMRSVQPLT
jgi:hypothetical protein